MPIGFPWDSRWIPIGIQIGFPLNSYGIPDGFLLDIFQLAAHGEPMGITLESNRNPMVIQQEIQKASTGNPMGIPHESNWNPSRIQ